MSENEKIVGELLNKAVPHAWTGDFKGIVSFSIDQLREVKKSFIALLDAKDAACNGCKEKAARLNEYAGWSPHQFLGVQKEHEALQKKYVALEAKLSEQAADAERMRQALIEVLDDDKEKLNELGLIALVNKASNGIFYRDKKLAEQVAEIELLKQQTDHSNKSCEVRNRELEAQIFALREALDEFHKEWMKSVFVTSRKLGTKALVKAWNKVIEAALQAPPSPRVMRAFEVVEAARRLLERIDFNGGLGEYKGGPAFVMKDMRDALALYDAEAGPAPERER